MMAALYAEFRKFLTVRSTYVVSALALVLAGAISFWGVGFKGGPVFSPTAIQDATLELVTIVSIFVGVLAILLICHEYRYNTIGYTLTATNNRLKVLMAKLTVASAYTLVMALLTIAVSVGLMLLGAKLAGSDMGTQTLHLYEIIWKSIAYMLGSSLFGLALGFLSRSLVFAIVAYFFLPSIEQLVHGLLKVSNNYLPFASQGQIMQTSPLPDVYSPLASLGVFAAYLGGLLIVATVLFVRRDSN